VVKACTAGGTILGNVDIGGIVGNNLYGAYVGECFSNVNLCAIENIGGVVGQNHGEIARSSSEPRIKGRRTAGKLIGLNSGKLKINNAAFQQYCDHILIFSEFIGKNKNYVFL
jgi:hypothetical protein